MKLLAYILAGLPHGVVSGIPEEQITLIERYGIAGVMFLAAWLFYSGGRRKDEALIKQYEERLAEKDKTIEELVKKLNDR